MANIFWTKHDIDNWERTLESTRGPYIVPKFHERWSTNGLKFYRNFYPSSVQCILFRPQSIAHAVSGINVASHDTALDLSAVRIRSPKSDFNLAMASRRAALGGNASFIATFSIVSFYFYSTHRMSKLLQRPVWRYKPITCWDLAEVLKLNVDRSFP